MAISRNNPFFGNGTKPRYNGNRASQNIAYYSQAIIADDYENLTLNFNWICEGEGDPLFIFDYGKVCWSTDLTNWTNFTNSGDYLGESTAQSVVGLDISEMDGQTFYLGFRWVNDGSVSNDPSFIVDDILVEGYLQNPCNTPTNQPSGLTLNASSNTISGTFTEPIPSSDNYLVVYTEIMGAIPSPVDLTTYNPGDSFGSATVVDTDNNNTFTATGLNQNTTYYFYIFSFNDQCLGGPLYGTITGTIGDDDGNATTTSSSFCEPETTTTASTYYIDDVEFLGTLNDVSNNDSGIIGNNPAGYHDFTSLPKSIQEQGKGINIFVSSNNTRGHYKAWVDWNDDGVFDNDNSDNPVGMEDELVYDTETIGTFSTTFGFIIPDDAIGDYRIRIRYFNSTVNGAENFATDFDACEEFGFIVDDNETPRPNDDIETYRYGEAEDYLFTVVESCEAEITSVTGSSRCGQGDITISAIGNAQTTEYVWYTTKTDINPIPAVTTPNYVISNLTQTTTYWVAASNGSCESLVRIPVTATVNPVTDLTISTASPSICGLNDIIELSTTSASETDIVFEETFEGSGFGLFSDIALAGHDNTSGSNWEVQNSPFTPTQLVWKPAIASGLDDNFAVINSDVGGQIVGPFFVPYTTHKAL